MKINSCGNGKMNKKYFGHFDNIVSLGTCCEITIMTNLLFGGTVRSPFDWGAAYWFEDVLFLFKTKFANVETEFKPAKLFTGPNRVHIVGTNALLPHYSCAEAKDKVVNRAQRLLSYLKETKDNVLFIRKNHLGFSIGNQQIQEFCHVISEQFPQLQYKLLLIEEWKCQDYKQEKARLDQLPKDFENVIYIPLVSDFHHSFPGPPMIIDCSLQNDPNGIKWWKDLQTTLEKAFQ
jgi:hypothetical protein